MTDSYLRQHALELALYALMFFISYKAIVYIQRLYFHPLSKFPGPRICAASRLYEFYWDSICGGLFWQRLPELHQNYGPIVRIGPNEVHIQDSDFFDTMFGFRPLNKEAMAAKQFGMKHALFGTEDYKIYTKRRAAFGDAFSRSKILKLQDMIVQHVDKACEYIRQRGDNGELVDLAFVFRATPAEIITNYLFGQEYGFLEDVMTTKDLYNKKDFDNLFGLIHLGRFIPWWIPMFTLLFKQLVKMGLGYREPAAAMMNYFQYAQNLVKKVADEHNNPTGWSTDIKHPIVFEDFLNSSLPEEDKKGAALTEQAVAIWSGGWDTVGFALTLGTYCLLKHPVICEHVHEELFEAWPDANEVPTVEMLYSLPYFNAVIKETLRCTQGVLCRLGRVNPSAPEHYKTWTIPPGTIISMSIPDVHADKLIWGPDPDTFRPERWLDSEREDLDRFLVTFSKGTRVCPGIELAQVELRIVLGTLFRRFDMTIPPELNITDDDILPFRDGFTPSVKNWNTRLTVKVSPSG